MGNGGHTTSEPAPSYDELFADHPVNRQPPAGSSSAYTTVPQDEPDYNNGPNHLHGEQQEQPPVDLEADLPGANDTPLQPVAGKPHVHCDQCERIAERRARLDRDKHCCSLVAATFIMLFTCVMVVGIIAFSRHH
ncbi:hypothetical protein BR93DRAFT_981148 [Coniochaeta sp. PMI_546]|nr:hypothetical protein BR93DRAFT_981148 [Coniochaeta sp. PMI_546]